MYINRYFFAPLEKERFPKKLKRRIHRTLLKSASKFHPYNVPLDEQTQAYRNLWISVLVRGILRVFEDYYRAKICEEPLLYGSHLHWLDWLDWFGTEDFDMVCDLAGFDSEIVYKRILHLCRTSNPYEKFIIAMRYYNY